MKIYVAGKNLERARSMMDLLLKNGHTITFDWITDIENEINPTQKARDERKAVKQADVLVYLWEGDQESARYEAGMAMGLNKPIIVSGFPKKNSFFLSLPEIISVSSDDEILASLKSLEKQNMTQEERDFWIRMSIHEIEAQAGFAQKALENIFSKGSKGSDLVFSSIHSLLSHCTNISKLLKANSDGVVIGEILKIPETSPIHQRKYRNKLEHYDEELQEWIKKQGVNVNIGLDNIGSKSDIELPNTIFVRHFDPETNTFTLIDEDYNLLALLSEVRTIHHKASTWILAVQWGKIVPPFRRIGN